MHRSCLSCIYRITRIGYNVINSWSTLWHLTFEVQITPLGERSFQATRLSAVTTDTEKPTGAN